jgi:hypothetical protein
MIQGVYSYSSPELVISAHSHGVVWQINNRDHQIQTNCGKIKKISLTNREASSTLPYFR